MKKAYYILFFFFSFVSAYLKAQENATVSGVIKDNEKNTSIELVNISVNGKEGTSTNKNGYFNVSVPANKKITLEFSFIGYETEYIELYLSSNEKKEINIKLKSTSYEKAVVNIEDSRSRTSTNSRLTPKEYNSIPTPQPDISSIIKSQGKGIASSNELSTAYSVRGGNYDENLVYVNDIEVYRPFLIKSGQQEGLSFTNPDLVSNILFSSGGFDSKYGDKMSSVLDIKYKEPRAFAGSLALSLLGGSFHLEGCSKTHRMTYLLGVRNKTNKYILNGLDTKGDYHPSFTDIQSYITYDITEKVEVNVLLNASQNKYSFIPSDRTTSFGHINEAMQLMVYFEGQEVDIFNTYTGAVSFVFKPTLKYQYKIIGSVFKTYESETYDILGQYKLGELENNLGSDNLGDVKYNKGVGSFLDHARNNLEATVYNISYIGKYEYGVKGNILSWGVKYQNENINDKISEWNLIDSAGYSLPHSKDSIGSINPNKIVSVDDVLKSNIAINSNRYSAYIQNCWEFGSDSNKYFFTIGIRSTYWDFNNENIISPRATIAYKPLWKKDWIFRFSTGYYYQQPFYRELRDLEGNINKNIKSQKSIHLVLGGDNNLKIWNRPFKFETDVYYKYLDDLIPYEIDNVQIKYYAENSAQGYATGIDFKLNGEFVNGVESWVNLSIMQSREDIKNDFYINENGERIEPGYIPRPTDQRLNFSLLFQDYLPKSPSYKMHISLHFGTGLPFGPPDHVKYKDTLRIPPYRRVDIGFSKVLIDENKTYSNKNIFKFFKSAWISLEVFNLLQINNTISYLWIRDVNSRMYAIPNYLTSRQLNLKLSAKF